MSLARRAAISLGVALTAALALPAAAATAAPAAAPSAQDRQWMVAAHQSNLTEIAAGKAAQQKATTAKVRNLGAMFIRDHTAQDAKLRAAAKSFGVDLPGSPNAQQRASLAAVAAKSGAAFDSAWIAAQTVGHRQTLAATDKELANGSDATVLKLARASRPVIAMHYRELTSGSGSPMSVGAGTGGQAAVDGTAPGLALTGAGVVLAAAAGGLLLARRRATA
jgi:putative membrane protein